MWIVEGMSASRADRALLGVDTGYRVGGLLLTGSMANVGT
jgi:hypothetical protein